MTLRETGPIAATVYRGEAIENTHIAHVAVVQADGRLLYSFGDPSRITLARSAAKPAQALAVLETGALERFGFDEADLALMCASHSSEPRHIERTRQMLAKAQVSEADLRCGGHPPLSDAVYIDWLKRDFKPDAVCSNCSGKHAGMLAGARSIGAAISGYELPEHPLQVRVKHTVAEVCDLPDDAVQWSIDGCNLPTPAFALDRLARLFAKLAAAEDETSASAAASSFHFATHRCARTHLSCDGGASGVGSRRGAFLYRVDAGVRWRADRQGRRRRQLRNRRAGFAADRAAWRRRCTRDCGEGRGRQHRRAVCDRCGTARAA